MTFPRSGFRATVLVAIVVTGLAGCSDDGGGDGDDRPKATQSPTASTPPVEELTCTTDVRLTGAVESAWKGEGTARVGERSTSYEAVAGQVSLQVYTGDDPAIGSSLLVNAAGFAFPSVPGTKGYDVARDGSRARVRADAASGQDVVHVAADFTCG